MIMAVTPYNPLGYNLQECDLLHVRFGEELDYNKDEFEVYDFINEYNRIPGKKIVAWLVGYNGSDFMDDRFTMRFYLSELV